MKILLVDAQADSQQKWVNPLRQKGWGAVLARSAEDASRMMVLHGAGVEALVVHEGFVSFAESQGKPFVVLTERWTDREILAHQNSKKPAVGYLPRSGAIDSVLGLFVEGRSQSRADTELKATGTGGGTRTGIRLQDASRILSSPSLPQLRRTSVSLSAPKIKLRHKSGKGEDTASGAMEPSLRLVPNEAEIEQPTAGEPSPATEEAPTLEPVLSEPVLSEPVLSEPVAVVEDLSSAGEPSAIEMASGIEDSPALELVSVAGEPDEIHGVLDLSLDLSTDLSVEESLAESHPSSRMRAAPSLGAVEMSPDLEAMKAYLSMREQDVAVLTGQVRSSKERISQLEAMLKAEKARNTELEEMLAKTDQTLKNYDLEKRVEMEVIQKHADDLDQQLRDKTDKARVIETRLRLMAEEVNKVKERVRVDIRRIRVREKELEGQLEILKKDSGALLQARDEKILELKRRNDLLEFNMELVQEQYEKERRNTEELKGKLKEAAQVMKQANGFLEQ